MFSTIDAPGAGVGEYQGTLIKGIDDAGDVAGFFYSDDYSAHGFTLTSAGVFTEILTPNSTYAIPMSISSTGIVVGYCDNLKFYYQSGFSLTLTGVYTPYSYAGGDESYVSAVNARGNVAGYEFAEPGEGVSGGFLGANGRIRAFFFPGIANYFSTNAAAINSSDAIAGTFSGTPGITSGYILIPSESLITVNVPGALSTFPVGLSNAFVLVGSFQQSTTTGLTGFIFTP